MKKGPTRLQVNNTFFKIWGFGFSRNIRNLTKCFSKVKKVFKQFWRKTKIYQRRHKKKFQNCHPNLPKKLQRSWKIIVAGNLSNMKKVSTPSLTKWPDINSDWVLRSCIAEQHQKSSMIPARHNKYSMNLWSIWGLVAMLCHRKREISQENR